VIERGAPVAARRAAHEKILWDAATRPHRARRSRIGKAAKRSGARFQGSFAAQKIIEFLLELLLVEELAAGGTVDARAQFGDTVFIGILLLRLPCHQLLEHVIAEGKISRSGDRPAGHDDDGAHRNPKGHRSEPDLPPCMRDGNSGAAADFLRLVAIPGMAGVPPRLRRCRPH
jgi:hypothetical protein